MSFRDKKSRTECYASRDRYWDCLDQVQPQDGGDTLRSPRLPASLQQKYGSLLTAERDPSGSLPCQELRRLCLQSCPEHWVKHFDRKRQYMQFRKKVAAVGNMSSEDDIRTPSTDASRDLTNKCVPLCEEYVDKEKQSNYQYDNEKQSNYQYDNEKNRATNDARSTENMTILSNAACIPSIHLQPAETTILNNAACIPAIHLQPAEAIQAMLRRPPGSTQEILSALPQKLGYRLSLNLESVPEFGCKNSCSCSDVSALFRPKVSNILSIQNLTKCTPHGNASVKDFECDETSLQCYTRRRPTSLSLSFPSFYQSLSPSPASSHSPSPSPSASPSPEPFFTKLDPLSDLENVQGCATEISPSKSFRKRRVYSQIACRQGCS